MTWFLDLRADNTGGNPAREVTVRQNSNICFDFRKLVEAVRGKNVLLGTHGFNVNRQKGIDKLSRWGNLLKLDDGSLFIGVLWPGDSQWAPLVDYPFEGNEAISSARLLAPFLNQYFVAVASLSFASHSLGARMVLETIRYLKLPIRRLVLMAGAINDNCLIDEYQKVAEKVEMISVLASHSDYVLKLAFPIGNPLAGIITRGHPYWRSALGHEGPVTPYPASLRSGWQIPDNWDYGHGDYLGGNPPPVPIPIDVPRHGAALPNSKPAWSAGFVSTRYQ